LYLVPRSGTGADDRHTAGVSCDAHFSSDYADGTLSRASGNPSRYTLGHFNWDAERDVLALPPLVSVRICQFLNVWLIPEQLPNLFGRQTPLGRQLAQGVVATVGTCRDPGLGRPARVGGCALPDPKQVWPRQVTSETGDSSSRCFCFFCGFHRFLPRFSMCICSYSCITTWLV
jgi:hypothetical protein